jgi:hypothetical protein
MFTARVGWKIHADAIELVDAKAKPTAVRFSFARAVDRSTTVRLSEVWPISRRGESVAVRTPLLATRSVVIPRLGLGTHEFVCAAPRLPYRNSWMPSLKLGMTIQFGSNTVQSHLPS